MNDQIEATGPTEAVFDSFSLGMTHEQARSASHQGQCDDDVIALMNEPEIAAQLDAIGPEAIRREVAQWSDWDTDSDEDNRMRLVWIAAGNIVDGR